MSIGPPIPEIQYFQNLTLKIKDQGQMTWCRTTTGLDNSIELRMVQIHPGVSEIWVPQSLAQVLPDLTSFWPMGKPIWSKWANNYDSAQLQVHTSPWNFNWVNPSSGFRDMRSAKSGPNLCQIWKVFGPWASPYGANGQMTMTVHNHRPRQFHRTPNEENPSSGYRDMGSASLAAACPPARTVTTIPLQPGGLRGNNRGVFIYEVEEVFPWGGISVIFSVYASISRVGVPSHEIDFLLDFRCVTEFYGALFAEN